MISGMAKRPGDELVDGNQAYLKRQRITSSAGKSFEEEIRSGEELRQLLSFDQDAARTRHGIIDYYLRQMVKLIEFKSRSADFQSFLEWLCARGWHQFRSRCHSEGIP